MDRNGWLAVAVLSLCCLSEQIASPHWGDPGWGPWAFVEEGGRGQSAGGTGGSTWGPSGRDTLDKGGGTSPFLPSCPELPPSSNCAARRPAGEANASWDGSGACPDVPAGELIQLMIL